jgi:hypothetical protein
MRLENLPDTSFIPVITLWVVTISYPWSSLKFSLRNLIFPWRHAVCDFGICPQTAGGFSGVIPNRPCGKTPLEAFLNLSIPQKQRRWAARPFTPLSPSNSKSYPAMILPMILLHRSAHRRCFWNYSTFSTTGGL